MREPVSTCVCLYMVCSCTPLCGWVHVDTRISLLVVFFYLFPTILFDTDSHRTWGFPYQLDWLAWELPGPYCVDPDTPPQGMVTGHGLQFNFVWVLWRSEFRSSDLYSKHVTHRALPSSPASPISYLLTPSSLIVK